VAIELSIAAAYSGIYGDPLRVLLVVTHKGNVSRIEAEEMCLESRLRALLPVLGLDSKATIRISVSCFSLGRHVLKQLMKTIIVECVPVFLDEQNDRHIVVECEDLDDCFISYLYPYSGGANLVSFRREMDVFFREIVQGLGFENRGEGGGNLKFAFESEEISAIANGCVNRVFLGIRQDRQLAVCMGLHSRIGWGSVFYPLGGFGDEILRCIELN
jgi:hypothetical protein